MSTFNKVIELIIKSSEGFPDKVNLEKFMESINHSFIANPGPLNYWQGVAILKSPLDMMILQEIIFEKRPDTIIECGTAFGGTAYYMAHLMDLMDIDGRIITIDLCEPPTSMSPKKDTLKINGTITTVDSSVHKIPVHPKIHFIQSDCLKADIPPLGNKTMLILDCDHSADHVYKELERFAPMVSIGQYIIVEDTDAPDRENGPAAAVKKFLSINNNFIVDKSREKYGISSNLGGYLLKLS